MKTSYNPILGNLNKTNFKKWYAKSPRVDTMEDVWFILHGEPYFKEKLKEEAE